ncbi:MAG: hypothetical protein H0V01_07625 [Bacteroidetes bacterium]|nr:hypothetical protein [Bacteroidota bacterium]HET6243112.1 heavy metal-binding domain-containing protein [Bacteroidia bacterium]
MKKQIIITTLSLVVIMFIASCGINTSETKSSTETEKIETAQYQCPMKCEGKKNYDKPGQCPVCNMDLEKVETTHENQDHNH